MTTPRTTTVFPWILYRENHWTRTYRVHLNGIPKIHRIPSVYQTG